jgi:predicted dehydrogenase
MRVGIVGTGFMGRAHAAGWAETPVEISGFVSKAADSAAELAEKYRSKVYDSLEALLADVDVVDICTPTHLHYEMVLMAAAAKKHIICEKPLARTVEQAQEMISVCESAGIKLLVAHVVRFFPEYALARQKVAAGEIGQPAVIRLKRGTFQPKKAEDNWFLDFSKSGGMMLDLMIHDFDYARWVAGNVATVHAQRIGTHFPKAAVDHGLVILTHQNGALSHVEGSWAYPPPLFRTRLEIAGSNGWLRYDSAETAALGIHLHQTQEDAPDVPLPGSPLDEDPYTTQIKSFYNHIAFEAPTVVSAVDGLAALQIALAAIESAESGQPVHLEQLAEVAA